MTVPTSVLIVLAGVATFLVLVLLHLWLGIVFLAASLLALAIYGMVRA